MKQQLNLTTIINAATFVGKDDRRISIPAGRLVGTLCVSAFVHPDSGNDCSGPTQIDLDGFVSDGRTVRYRTVIGPASFAPLPEDEVTITQHHVGPAYAIAYMPSEVERQSLDVSIVPRVRMVGKYVTVNSAVWPSGSDSLMVHYSFNSDDSRAIGGFLTLQFKLPVVRLLWRKAPLIAHEHCIPEAANYVDADLY